jgi:catechol 2,3-dioxygenase-like lactoylglutathione lyase family enzyme
VVLLPVELGVFHKRKEAKMMILDDLLNAGNWSQTVDGLAHEFRQAHGLPEIHQLGLVVPDVEDAASRLEARGIAPFFIAEGAPVLWRERGQERQFRGMMGIAYHHGVELELLAPGTGSDFYRQGLDPEGRIVVQHLGLAVENVDEWAGRLDASGVPVWVRGQLKLGPVGVDFAYMDSLEQAGVVVEFICWRLFGRVFSPPPGVFHTVGRLEKWSGHRSLAT